MAQIDISSSRKREYRDLSLYFTKNPVTNDVAVVSGADAVKRAIRTLLLTNEGEVPFLPGFGSRLNTLLFEPIHPMTTAAIEADIRATLDAFEPRAKILTLTVTPTPDENRYDITVVMSLRNIPDPITLTLFLNRLR
jgi:phage baseplate assembly protein W